MATILVNGVRLYCEESGSGPPARFALATRRPVYALEAGVRALVRPTLVVQNERVVAFPSTAGAA